MCLTQTALQSSGLSSEETQRKLLYSLKILGYEETYIYLGVLRCRGERAFNYFVWRRIRWIWGSFLRQEIDWILQAPLPSFQKQEVEREKDQANNLRKVPSALFSVKGTKNIALLTDLLRGVTALGTDGVGGRDPVSFLLSSCRWKHQRHCKVESLSELPWL